MTGEKVKSLLKEFYNYNTVIKHIPYMRLYKQILYGEHKIYEETIEKIKVNDVETEYKKKHPIKSLRTNIKACKEFASLMFNEEIDFFVESKDTKKLYTREIEYLKNFYEEKNLWAKMENCIIDVLGIGAVGIVVGYDPRYKTQINFYDGYNIYPLNIVDDEVKEVAFLGKDYNENNVYYLNIHTEIWEDKTEIIDNELIKAKELKGYKITYLTIVDGIIDESQTYEYVSDVKMFSILKPFTRKSTDYTSAFGIPIYLDELDIIEYIDRLFHISYKDLNMTQPLLVASQSLFKNERGEDFVPDFYGMFLNIIKVNTDNMNSIENPENIIQHINPQTKLDTYINQILQYSKMLGLGLGLGADGLSWEKIATPTATQVLTENKEKFNTLKKHFQQMKAEIGAMNRAILYVAKINNEGNFDLPLITYNTKDNVLVDDETKREVAQSEVDKELMSTDYYLQNIRQLSGEDLVEERKKLGLNDDGIKENTEINAESLYEDNNNNIINTNNDNNKNNDKENIE